MPGSRSGFSRAARARGGGARAALGRARGVFVLVALAGLAFACGGTRLGSVHAALHQDLVALRAAIAEDQRSGRLDRDGLTELSRAVLRRELWSAAGEPGALTVWSMLPCAGELESSLRERAGRTDAPAVEATLILLSLGRVGPGELFARYREETGAWRAVAARAALSPSQVLTRRAWFRDADPRVRRAALAAAFDAPEPGDQEALVEALRLDPDPMSRSLAARALGALGGEASVMAMMDVYARADTPTRLSMIDALARSRALHAGGDRELRRFADADQGLTSVAAAQALVESGDQDGALVGLLASAIEHGADADRTLAIQVAPLGDARVLEALSVASKGAAPLVRVAALTRLLRVGDRRNAALEALRELGRGGDAAGAQARLSLAAQGERSVIAALRQDLARAEHGDRRAAALALLDLGRAPDAASLLADPYPDVRVGIACAVVSRE